MSLGSRLRDAWLDEEVTRGLGRALSKDLEELIDLHTHLVRSYLSGALLRLQELSKVAIPAAATPEMVVDAIERAVQQIQRSQMGELPDADPQDKAVLADMALHLRELNEERDRSVDPARRAALEKKIAEKGTEAAQTIIGLVLKGGKATLGGGAVLADLKTLFPESFATAWSKLWDLFGVS